MRVLKKKVSQKKAATILNERDSIVKIQDFFFGSKI